jgi:hypothetical protein
MKSNRKADQKLQAWFLIFGLVLLLAVSTWAQSAATQAPSSAAAVQQSPSKTTPPASGADKAAPKQSEQKISPKEAEELFRSVDEILKFVSDDTGLPIKDQVKRQLATREQVVSYLEKNMAEDKDAKRLQRSELVLKKFGLLPNDFDLKSFLVSLLREQVAGYYDPKTKTVNLLDWLNVDEQRPVLAHELTHALQDQSFDLEKWLKEGDTDIDDKETPTAADIAADEIGTAREAVVEGQAMVSLMDYMLAPVGKSLATDPQLAQAMENSMFVGTEDLPQFKSAPIFLRESLIFPYRYGMAFTAELMQKEGKEKAFSGVFRHPPESSRQIMEPKTYLSGEHIEPMRLPDFKNDFKNYDRFDIGAIGECDVAVLVEQYAGKDASQNIYPQWRGGYYYAVRPKADAAAPLGVLYLSRWADAAGAGRFAAIYAGALSTRYKHVSDMADADGKQVAKDHAGETLSGTHRWKTEDGLVEISVRANDVLITENLDQPTTDRLEQELLPAAAQP